VTDESPPQAGPAESRLAPRLSRRTLLGYAGDWLGVRCLYARDPDGVTIELVERPVVPGPVAVPDLEAARSDEG